MKWPIVLFSVLLIIVIVGPMFAPYDALRTQPERQNQAPSSMYIMGTDFLGRDVLSRVLVGGQRTVTLAIGATVIAMAVGGPVGVAAGYLGGWLDRIAAATINALLAFPPLIIALIVVSVFGQAEVVLITAVGFSLLPLYAQMGRSAALAVRNAEYVESSRALGGGAAHILRIHVLRNSQPTLTAYAAVIFSYALLNIALLGFLGVTGEPGIPEWGAMLAEGRAVLRAAPWVSLFPGLALTLTVLLVNRAASGISHAL